MMIDDDPVEDSLFGSTHGHNLGVAVSSTSSIRNLSVGHSKILTL